MKLQDKFRYLAIASATCLLLLILQSIYLYRLDSRLDKLQDHDPLVSALGQDQADPVLSDPIPDPFLPDLNDPFTSLRQMQEQADRLFGSIAGINVPGIASVFSPAAGSPEIHVNETDKDFQIVVEVPKDSRVDLQTDVEDNTVHVAGTITQDTSSAARNLNSTFRSRSQFSRSIELPEPVNPLAIRTEQQGDEIVITLPKIV